MSVYVVIVRLLQLCPTVSLVPLSHRILFHLDAHHDLHNLHDHTCSLAFDTCCSHNDNPRPTTRIFMSPPAKVHVEADKNELTLVRPWKTIGSFPGPSQYANVQMACADLSSNPTRSLCMPSGPTSLRNHLLLVVDVLVCERGVEWGGREQGAGEGGTS